MTTPKAKFAGLALIAALCAGFTLGLTVPAWAGSHEAWRRSPTVMSLGRDAYTVFLEHSVKLMEAWRIDVPDQVTNFLVQPGRKTSMFVKIAMHNALSVRVDRAKNPGKYLIWKSYVRVSFQPKTSWAEVGKRKLSQVLRRDLNLPNHRSDLHVRTDVGITLDSMAEIILRHLCIANLVPAGPASAN